MDDDAGSYLIDITDEKDKTVRNLSRFSVSDLSESII